MKLLKIDHHENEAIDIELPVQDMSMSFMIDHDNEIHVDAKDFVQLLHDVHKHGLKGIAFHTEFHLEDL